MESRNDVIEARVENQMNQEDKMNQYVQNDQREQKEQSRIEQQESEQRELVEDQQLRRRARWLLKNFRKFLEQKHKQEEEIKNTPLFTKDDALYVLSGLAAHKGGERVQTSNLSNAPETAAMNVDETLERMNREVLAEVSKGYDELCERINIFNVALMLMDLDVRCVAKQVFCEGIRRDKVVAADGHYYCRQKVREMIRIAERAVMDTLEHINLPDNKNCEETLDE